MHRSNYRNPRPSALAATLIACAMLVSGCSGQDKTYDERIATLNAAAQRAEEAAKRAESAALRAERSPAATIVEAEPEMDEGPEAIDNGAGDTHPDLPPGGAPAPPAPTVR